MHFKDAKNILSPKNGMNIYRGCTHGCIYCDSRSKCYNMSHDFEDIEVKQNALILLEDTLKKRRTPCMVSTGAMTDPYLHVEEELQYTRKSLELILKYRFGINLLTKSCRIKRDFDLLEAINSKTKCVVQMTLTTYDEKLCKIVEPNVHSSYERFEVLKLLHQLSIPTIVWLGPILPFINDTEENLKGLLNYCLEAGVKGILCFGMGLTLREGNREFYYSHLDKHFKGLKKAYQQKYGNSYILNSDSNAQLMKIFTEFCCKNNILYNTRDIFNYLNQFELKSDFEQLSLFNC